MYAQVKLLNGFYQLLWYKLPQTSESPHIGTIVQVPLRTQVIPALIISVYQTKPAVSYEVKSIIGYETLPADPAYIPFIEQLAYYHAIAPFQLIQRMRSFIQQKEQRKQEQILENSFSSEYIPPLLTMEQQICADAVLHALDNNSFEPIVIHGVTGSGKTEIYKAAITRAYAQQKTTLLLLPEVSLARAFAERLSYELPHIPITAFHSGTSARGKKDTWTQLIAHIPLVIIGVHQPILLPIAHLGIIIVDEEHDAGYQEKKHPKIHTRDAAILRAYHAHIPILLGSATPSMSTLHNVATKKWKMFTLKQRFTGEFPRVTIVDLLGQKDRRRTSFWISSQLEHALADRLAKRQQSIIYINRRGLYFFILCTICTEPIRCINCSVTLTVHEHEELHCHYCGRQEKIPEACPHCQASRDTFLSKGIGTQHVTSVLQKLFPSARIARADTDISRSQKKWYEILDGMRFGVIDILVGTQTITKGYHFPEVTLVGIIWADLNLHFPFYAAGETTLQSLIQVAGRAGRSHTESDVIMQCMQHHPLFNFIEETTYVQYYEQEIAQRIAAQYPPYWRLVEIELRSEHSAVVEQDSKQIAGYIKKNYPPIAVLGPAAPPVHRVNGMHIRTIYCKAASMKMLVDAYQSIDQSIYKSTILFTPNPTR